MKKVISVTREQKAFLRKAFKVSGQMVYLALTFDEKRGNTPLAERIRSLALQRGGFTLLTLPESEVVHDADGWMRQHFRNGWMWECDKRTGRLELRDASGRVVETHEDATMRDLEALQRRVAAIC